MDAAPAVWRGGEHFQAHRAIPEEVPGALTYDSSSYAVMMASRIRDQPSSSTGPHQPGR
jgi:hypothetical protein